MWNRVSDPVLHIHHKHIHHKSGVTRDLSDGKQSLYARLTSRAASRLALFETWAAGQPTPCGRGLERESLYRALSPRGNLRNPWSEMSEKSSPGGTTEFSPALQCVRENSFSRNPVERSTRESSPGGASQRSPALSAQGKAGQEVDQMAQPPEESSVATPSGARKWNAIKLQPRSGDTGKPGTSVPGRQRSKRESRQGRHRVATQTPEGRPSSHPRHGDV